MKGVSHCDMHGLMAHENWHAPIEVVTCEEENRPGYDSMPVKHLPHIVLMFLLPTINRTQN